MGLMESQEEILRGKCPISGMDAEEEANSPTLTHRAWGTRKTSSKVKYRDGIMPPRRSRAMRETRATRLAHRRI